MSVWRGWRPPLVWDDEQQKWIDGKPEPTPDPVQPEEPPEWPHAPGAVLAALEVSIADAGKRLELMDGAALMACRVLAQKIDAMVTTPGGVSADGSLSEGQAGKGIDNVTLPVFLKYLDALGLTPGGRRTIEVNKGGKPTGSLQRIRGQVRAAQGLAAVPDVS